VPERQDFAHRRVKFNSTGVGIGGHVRPPPWSTKDLNNADFDTRFMTPRPRSAPQRRRLSTPPNTPGQARPRVINHPTSTTPPPRRDARPHDQHPKPPGPTRDSAPVQTVLGSLQESRTRQLLDARYLPNRCCIQVWASYGTTTDPSKVVLFAPCSECRSNARKEWIPLYGSAPRNSPFR
jgi:hypothetical protein